MNHRWRSQILLLVMLMGSVSLAGEKREQGGCILYGEKWAVLLSAPPGWAISCADPKRNGVEVALWPAKSSWRESVAVMYVKSAARREGQSLQVFADDEVASFKAQQPSVAVVEGPPVSTTDGRPGVVRYFVGDQWGNREAVAYVDAGEAFLIFVLTSKREREFKRYEPAFRWLVTKAGMMQARIEKK